MRGGRINHPREIKDHLCCVNVKNHSFSGTQAEAYICLHNHLLCCSRNDQIVPPCSACPDVSFTLRNLCLMLTQIQALSHLSVFTSAFHQALTCVKDSSAHKYIQA